MTIKNKLKKITAVALTGLALSPVQSVFAETNIPAEPEIDSDAAFIIDYDTQKVLLNQNGDTAQPIASMTKMIVDYLLYEAIDAGKVTWDQEVPVSEYAHEISQDLTLSNVPLRQDETYTIKELHEALIIYSANGATIAIAEAIAESEPAFVDMMREKVESWGITDYLLVNATGLNNSYLGEHKYPGSGENQENLMTPRDMIFVAHKVMEDYPQVLEVSRVPATYFREGTDDETLMINWNWMLAGLPFYREGVDGLKTGTTELSGANFIGTAVEEDSRLLTVIYNAGDGFINKAQRFEETDRMMDYGFDNFTNVQVPGEAFEQVSQITVSNGMEETARIEPQATVTVTVPNDYDAEDFAIEFQPDPELVDTEGYVKAPFNAGEEVGHYAVTFQGAELGYLNPEQETASVPAVTAYEIEEANVFQKAMNWIGTAIDTVISTVKGWLV